MGEGEAGKFERAQLVDNDPNEGTRREHPRQPRFTFGGAASGTRLDWASARKGRVGGWGLCTQVEKGRSYHDFSIPFCG